MPPVTSTHTVFSWVFVFIVVATVMFMSDNPERFTYIHDNIKLLHTHSGRTVVHLMTSMMILSQQTNSIVLQLTFVLGIVTSTVHAYVVVVTAQNFQLKKREAIFYDTDSYENTGHPFGQTSTTNKPVQQASSLYEFYAQKLRTNKRHYQYEQQPLADISTDTYNNRNVNALEEFVEIPITDQ